tara:strand:- start:618 stop:1361 length:744 start_codon:yes stop_codon:yes gene_type:complete
MTNITSDQATSAMNLYSGQHSIFTLVIGESGRGKTTALRNLPPERTHLINVVGKAIPFPSGVNYVLDKNMTISASGPIIREAMKKASANESVDYLVVDDLHYIMATEFMDKAMVKGYDKFTMMARNIWDLLVSASHLRAGLKVFFLCHEEETITGRRMKTLGKLLAEKLTPEGMATIVLWAEVDIPEVGNPRYFFSTQTDGTTSAKSPMGMFPAQIPNDLFLVSQRIDEYYQGVELNQSPALKGISA